jgi:pyruvate-ferredoxin/flavodoxin oxidoreductase
MAKQEQTRKYPGRRDAMDGNTIAIMCERESTDAAGAYPITPSTQMGEYWAEAAAAGHLNISGRPLIFVEPEGEHAAAAVTAGMSMSGLRASNFSSGQGIAYMHESLYAAVGKRLPYVLNIGARAMTKASLNVHAGHDDYHCIDDTGFFQLFAKNAQEVADLNIISHRVAELALTPGALAQDGFLTTHLIESVLVPERELIAEFLGKPSDLIDSPTPAQRIIFGDKRRRVPELWSVDDAVMVGVVQNQDAYMQSVAAQRPFFFDHIRQFIDDSFKAFHALTGRSYQRVDSYRADDADYLIVGQGSMISSAEAVADYLRKTRNIKVGVVNMTMWRPFPADLIGRLLKGKKGVAVLERLDQPLADDQPMMKEIRAALGKCIENGVAGKTPPYPECVSYQNGDLPALYSGAYGMGSRDLQPEGLIGAVENMLPNAKRQKQFYLSIDFVRKNPHTPKQRLHQSAILESYPQVQDLAVHGSENPNLMPEGSITVRFHSVGGWGAITTGKNLAMTLFDLLGYHIKANPKYGSEKKGQPTTYYLSAAPEPIRINCEYIYVDVVLSPDPAVLKHTNALAGLKEGGVFVIQSERGTAVEAWGDIPAPFRKIISDKNIRVFHIDGFKIAREEASDPELMLRMQGIAFQGAFFRASPLMGAAGFTEEKLFAAIEVQLQHKFGTKGARVVQDNLRVVRRGYDETHEIPTAVIESQVEDKAKLIGVGTEPPLPVMLKRQPQSKSNNADIHRFWEQTGNFYARGMGNDTITDPFVGLSIMPAVTGVFRNMTGIRFDHPEWVPQNCTACGKCWTVCPDTAIPGLVSEISAVFDAAIGRLNRQGKEIKFLPKALRQAEGQLRTLIEAHGDGSNPPVAALLDRALGSDAVTGAFEAAEYDALKEELDLFKHEIGDFQFAVTRPYYDVHEAKAKGSGGLLSITVNPYTCKGCMECVEVCDDDALRSVRQTETTIKGLEHDWDFWLDLPTTPQKYIRIDDLEQRIGALETMLLDKEVYQSLASGDGACLGCSEKTVIHLFTATVTSLMQPRVKKRLEQLDELIDRLQKHIQFKLVEPMDVGDDATVDRILDESGDGELTLAGIAGSIEHLRGSAPIDPEWFRRVTGLLAQLKDLRWKYSEGISGKGRSHMGMLNSTGCTSVWGSTYPFNPYPFPWANHLFQDSTSVALGVFEGHMARMADGFRAVRQAELELEGKYDPATHDEFFTYFNWHQFSDEEWLLCPPVVALGGDGAMYDIGFQNLSRAMMSGKPIKVVVVDTQVYSNTGGQACTAGFTGQVSDMAQHGKVTQGKEEIRKEIGLIAMAHRTTYVMQSTMAYPSHMIEGFIEGLMSRRPALFNLYTSCQPEHGIADDVGHKQAKLAVESRAYPLFRYNPDAGKTPADCLDLGTNPDPDADWPTYRLQYVENGVEQHMEVPMTFVDFAVTEGRFRKHFRVAPSDTWNDSMVPLDQFLQLEDREGRFPYIWAVDRKQKLNRVLVAMPLVDAAQDRLDFWTTLKALAGADAKPQDDNSEEQIRAEIMQNLTQNFARLLAGGTAPLPQTTSDQTASAAMVDAVEVAAPNAASPQETGGEYMAPWIDSPQCTACDECINLNGKIFVYNQSKQAIIKDPQAGPYSDLVKAAEKCTAQVIHPGLPADRSAKDIDRWIARGEKHN